MRPTRLIVLLTSLALFAAACGGADTATDTPSDSPAVTEDASAQDASAEDTSESEAAPPEASEDASGTEAAAGDGSEGAAAADPDSEFCTAVQAFTSAISEEPSDPAQGEEYLAEALAQLDTVAASAPDAASESVTQVVGYFEEFDALLAEVGYDVEAVDQEAIAASAATYAEGLASFESQVQAECGLSLSGP